MATTGSQLAILWSLRLIIVLAAVWGLITGEWEAFFISVMALVLTFIPELLSRKYKIVIPIEYNIVLALFIFASVVLGEVGDAYERFWWWDAVLHVISGVVLAMAGFLILYTLKHQGKLDASPFIIATFVFTFGMAFGAVWEIFEFAVDGFFGTNMQKNGLQDTMWDLIVDGIGSLAVAIAAYSIVQTNKRHGIVGTTLERFLSLNPRFKHRRIWRKREQTKRPPN